MRVIPAGGGPFELGVTETNPTVSIVDYSRRTTDEFGVTSVVKRGFARRMSVRFQLATADVDAVQRRLAELRATVATWIVDDRFAWLSASGFYKDFEVDLATGKTSFCTLTVEGLAETETVSDPGTDPAPVGQASSLRLLQPADVSEAVLAGSSIVENEHPQWAAGTTYPAGARVLSTVTHRVYESAVAANVGEDPTAGLGKWIDVGPTNRWAMFDQALGTTSAATTPIIVKLNPQDAVTGLAVLDATAATIRVQADGYDRTLPAGAGAVLFLDLQVPAGTAIFVTVSGASGATVSVGTLLFGRLVGLGVTEASPTAGITDFSRKEVDEFGTATVVPRAWAKRMAAKALVQNDAIDVVANRVAGARGRPALWIGDATLDSLTVYGFFKDFSIEVGETVSKLSLSIEGLSAASPLAPLKAATDWPDVGDPDGTKPADNADVTADHISKDTNAVGGRPAQDVLQALDAAGDVTAIQGEIDDALTAAKAYADQVGQQSDLHLDTAVQGLNSAIGLAGTAATYAKTAIDDANSDINQRIAAAAAAGNSAGVRVTTIENRLDNPGTGIVARLTTTETLINQPGVGLAARTSTLETSLGQATSRLSTVEATVTTPGTGLVSRTTTLETSGAALDAAVNGAGGVKARLTTVETTLYDATTGIAQRTSSLETSYGNVSSRVSTIEQSLSGGNSNSALAQRTTTLETQMGDRTSRILTLETSYSDPITGVARRLTDLTTTVGGNTSRLTTVESAINDPSSGLVRRTSDLTVNYRPTGNLVPNSALTTLDGWIFSDVAGGGTMSLNRAGTPWMLGGVENNLTLHQPIDKGDGEYSEASSARFAVTPGSTIQFYAYAMSHRARHWVSLYWFDASAAVIGYAGEHLGARANEGGQDPNAWEITGLQAIQVPGNAVSAQMLLRQYGYTREPDRYSWFSRPFVGEVPAGCTAWMTYTPGDNRVVSAATIASLKTTQTVLGDASGGVVKQANDLQVNYGGVNSRLGTVETVVGGPGNGLVKQVSDLSTTVGGVNATATAALTATTDGRFAASTRVASLEAASTADGSYQNANPRQSVWPDGQELPTGWGWWQKNGDVVREARPASEGGYMAQVRATSSADHGHVEGGVSLTAGWHVLEADVEYVAGGSWVGSGITLSGVYNLDFAAEPDINGIISNDPGYVTKRRFSKLIQITSTGSYNVHAMTNWSPFGGVSKYLRWRFCGVRPATDGEIKAQKADTSLNGAGGVLARLSSAEAAYTDGRFASASRASTLEAQMAGNAGSNLLSRLQTTEAATTDGRFASASVVTNLNTQVNGGGGLVAQLNQTASVASDARGRVSSYWGIDLIAGGRARIRAYADGYGSLVDIGADVIYLGNDRTFVVQAGKATVNGDLYLGAGRIVMDNGSVMKVQGTGFGSSNQFIEWFGPRQTNLSACTEANATYYLRVDGSAYFGGSLRSGVIRNAVQTTSAASYPSIDTGTVGSNGGQRTVVASYAWQVSQAVDRPQNGNSGSLTAHVVLSRNGVDVASFDATGYWQRTYAQDASEPGDYSEQMGGSVTFTDNSGGGNVSYQVRVTSRTFGPGAENGSNQIAYYNPSLSIIETEG